MDDKVRKALDERILAELEDISKMESGCEVKRAAVDDLTAMYKLRLEEIKLENELEEKKLSMVQQDCERKERKIGKILDIATSGFSVSMPLIFYGVWMKRGLEFEKTGILKSTTFKNLIHWFKPGK